MLERYDVASGAVLGRSRFPTAASRISLAGRWGVYRVGRRIFLLDVKSGRRTALAATRADPQGPVIEGRRVFWAEDYRNGSRIREVLLR